MIASLKNVDEVEVEITMTRSGHKGSFLLLEGEDDSRFWEPRVKGGHCEVVIGGCKPTVIEAVRRLDQRRFGRAVAIVDDDCDRLRGLPPMSKNVVHTDVRDLVSRGASTDRVRGGQTDPVIGLDMDPSIS